MHNNQPIDIEKADQAVHRGFETVAAARGLRKKIRRRLRRTSHRRQEQIAAMLMQIDNRMRVIRSLIAKLAYHDCPGDLADSLRQVSAELQAERRKLKKMR